MKMAKEDLRHWHNNLNLKNRSQGEKTRISEYFYIISNNAFKFEVIPTRRSPGFVNMLFFIAIQNDIRYLKVN